jgi:hypothetical protein
MRFCGSVETAGCLQWQIDDQTETLWPVFGCYICLSLGCQHAVEEALAKASMGWSMNEGTIPLDPFQV